MNTVITLPEQKQVLCGKQGSSQQQAGMTLLELLISMSLGLLLLGGIGSIYVGSNQTYRVQEQNARIQESGRYALEVLGRSLRQAGYWHIATNPISRVSGFSGTPITGADGDDDDPDTVTVQYDAVPGDRDCEGTVIEAADLVAPAESLVVTDALSLNGTDLECDGNADGAADPQPLVSNVEDVQLLYGVDTNNPRDQSANLYTAEPADWTRVVSVRACVLIQSEENGITATAQKYLGCADALTGSSTLTAATDRRLRRTFVATFNLRNRVSMTQ